MKSSDSKCVCKLRMSFSSIFEGRLEGCTARDHIGNGFVLAKNQERYGWIRYVNNR